MDTLSDTHLGFVVFPDGLDPVLLEGIEAAPAGLGPIAVPCESIHEERASVR